jgi:hypothetical protein
MHGPLNLKFSVYFKNHTKHTKHTVLGNVKCNSTTVTAVFN